MVICIVPVWFDYQVVQMFSNMAQKFAAISSRFLRALLWLLVVCFHLLVVVGLQCPGCGDKRDCPSVVDCPGGTVPDPCGCCLECARTVNQTCGGRYRSEGKCDEGLVCVITPLPGAVITGEEVGVCRGMTLLYCVNSSSK